LSISSAFVGSLYKTKKKSIVAVYKLVKKGINSASDTESSKGP